MSLNRRKGANRQRSRSHWQDAARQYRSLAFENCESRRLLAVDVERIGDINTAFLPSGADPQSLTPVGSLVYFTASTPAEGRELWVTDGTEPGTHLVRDITPGDTSSYLDDLINVNGTLYFAATDFNAGRELWKSDGTAVGTVRVTDISPGPASSNPDWLTFDGTTLFFTADDGINGRELWKSNSTFSVFAMVSIRSGSTGSNPEYLTADSAGLFFSADNGTSGVELFKYDGLSAQQIIINPSTSSGSFPRDFTRAGGLVYFSANNGANGRELWSTNGTQSGTNLVADLWLGSVDSNPTNLTAFDGRIFFTANDGTNGQELWRAPGYFSAVATRTDIRTGSLGSNPSDLTVLNGSLMAFSADNGTSSGRELWKVMPQSDPFGTTYPPTLIRDIQPGPNGSDPKYFENVNGTLYFSATTNSAGREIWYSDGSYAYPVADIHSGAESSYPRNLTNANGTLYFAANDGTAGYELWKAPPAPSQPVVLVKDIDSSTASSFTGVDESVTINGIVYFSGRDAQGTGLWRSDGTPDGTWKLKSGTSDNLTNVNGLLYFTATDATHGHELWQSDGTIDGTRIVKDIRPGTASSNPNSLIDVGGTLFFFADDGTHGNELWKSNGTSTGTVLVRDILLGPYGSASFQEMASVGGVVYFAATDGVLGTELWRSDGTSAGTTIRANINGLTGQGSDPQHLTALGSTLYFNAFNGSDYELWSVTGSSSAVKYDIHSTSSSDPHYLTVANGQLFFTADDGANGVELWRMQGSSPQRLTDIASGAAGSYPGELTSVNSDLFFAASDGSTNGRELWKWNGTTATLVKDIRPGPSDSSSSELTNVGGTLYFRAWDGIGGGNLWQSNGTTAGTVPVVDQNGQRTAEVVHLTQRGNDLMFAGISNEFGTEWYSVFNQVDFGDGLTATPRGLNGARHNAAGPLLGYVRDTESDGNSGLLADYDDLHGYDDEDGVTLASPLIRDKTSNLHVTVSGANPTARLNVWMDWNHDGDVDDVGEHVAHDLAVGNGMTVLPVTVPGGAMLGTTRLRVRLSDQTGLGPTGFSFSGEVEDYAFGVTEDVLLDRDEQGQIIEIKKSGSNLIVTWETGVGTSTIYNQPLAYVNSLTVRSSNGFEDSIVLVNFDNSIGGGFFTLPGGIEIAGSYPETVVVLGTGVSDADFSTPSAPPIQVRRQLSLVDPLGSTEIRTQGMGQWQFGGMRTFRGIGALDIGTGSLIVESSVPVDLPAMTTMDGGLLQASAMVLGPGEALIGHGTIDGRFSGDVGSSIVANGTLSIGTATSPAGFATRGDLYTDDHTVTLLDANQAVLGGLTTLGTLNAPGTISAANGLLIDFGNNVIGFGTLDTPNVVTKRVINNGSITGNSLAQPITLPGYLKGVGALDNVNITGTNSPGFSPAIVYFGSVSYGPFSNTILELGGTTPGTGHDQIVSSGSVSLAGSLDVQLINGFVPVYGNVFDVMTWTGTRTGQFTGFRGLLLNSNSVAVISKYEANRLRLVATGPGDANLDGRVSFADFLALQNHFSQPGTWQDGDFNLDGNVTFADFLILQNRFNTVYFSGPLPSVGLMPIGGTNGDDTTNRKSAELRLSHLPRAETSAVDAAMAMYGRYTTSDAPAWSEDLRRQSTIRSQQTPTTRDGRSTRGNAQDFSKLSAPAANIFVS